MKVEVLSQRHKVKSCHINSEEMTVIVNLNRAWPESVMFDHEASAIVITLKEGQEPVMVSISNPFEVHGLKIEDNQVIGSLVSNPFKRRMG